jgi:alanyl-tRNA synthetase
MAERLYYEDSFLSTFEAEVTDIREHARREGGSEWRIALDRSAFYPTSGGQPYDIGHLTATSRSGATLDVPVTGVEEDDAGEVWHATSKPLLAGTKVTGHVDWSRRLDHIQQHSGQHLLSAIIAREIGATTVSFHLGDDTSTIDLSIDALPVAVQEKIEQQVNLAIAEDLPVTVRTIDRAEADTLLAAGILRKLPEREGPIRLVEMPGIDLNACGGTHVRALGQIGGLLLRGTEKVPQGVRLSFVCGLRAVRSARADDALLTAVAKSLSGHRGSLPEMVERKLLDAKADAKEKQKLREELADYHAARLLVEDPVERGLRIVHRNFTDRDAMYVKLLASRLVAAAPQTVVILSSSQEDPAAIIFARSKDQDQIRCGEWLASTLAEQGSRGGGSPEMAQGQIASQGLASLVTSLSERVRMAHGAQT